MVLICYLNWDGSKEHALCPIDDCGNIITPPQFDYREYHIIKYLNKEDKNAK